MVTQNIPRDVVRAGVPDARISALLGDLEGRDAVAREKARKALVAVGKPAVPFLIQLLSHRRAHVRWEAAMVLCGIADPISATALVGALDDPDNDVRWVAAEGVAALDRDGLVALLAALLERSQSIWFRQGAHHVCHALVTKRRLRPILEPLLAAFDRFQPQMGVPLAAYTALSKLRELLR